MKLESHITSRIGLAVAATMFVSLSASAQKMDISFSGDTAIVKVVNPARYLILPIEESQNEARVKLDRGSTADVWMDVRLAKKSMDYQVPFALGEGKTAVVKMLGVKKGDFALKKMKLSDEWNVKNTDYYRPVYHHTPEYGWMNDANGIFYKDGEYHLYFQYNPYGSKWGNMHWGHSVSKDLVHWQHLSPAIARDTLGQIFSGSSVVDKDNCSGFGKNAIVAYYTSASPHRQVQCMAYSNDNGRTFTKYQGNPVLTPFDGLENFRDPKVFWYEPNKAWYLIVSADKEMRFYRSHNLIDWTYRSAFGKGYGVQPNQFECPDFFPLTVNGTQKWVMIVNVNPGCLFGGSATEYFVGNFDGTRFTCDDKPEVAKFLDYGKDHYATVTFSNTGSRIVGIPWMSNWQYANDTPIKQYRGANALPRELTLFQKDGETFMSANAVSETRQLRRQTLNIDDIHGEKTITKLFDNNDGAFEIEADILPGDASAAGIDIMNAQGEVSKIYLDMVNQRLVMDRTKSGLTDFANHPVEQQPTISKNDFTVNTWAPLNLCEGKTYHMDIFVDKCSIEIFVDGGRIAMTNLVFPTTTYNALHFYSEDGKAAFQHIKAYKLAL